MLIDGKATSRPGQPLTMVVTGDEIDAGLWYSPDAVREAMKQARREALVDAAMACDLQPGGAKCAAAIRAIKE